MRKEPVNLLITGGCGFIGTNFLRYFLKKYPQIHIINLDKMTYASNPINELLGGKYSNYTFIKGDITDFDLIPQIFNDYKIEGVIHFAAESHVDNSIGSPGSFIKTNIEGTFNLLENARKYWAWSPHELKLEYKDALFYHISTDEVYGSLGKAGKFNEESPYKPNSPYSATKASSDMLVRAYHKTYGIQIVVSNCSNNYGAYQHKEKLIPTVIRKALSQELIPVYGKGENVRDWLFVEDHCRAIDLIYFQGKNGETYNIGGGVEMSNLDIVKKICSLLDEKVPKKNKGSYTELIDFVKDRPGHDFRYAIDDSKLRNALGYETLENFDSGINKTIDWYLTHKEKLK